MTYLLYKLLLRTRKPLKIERMRVIYTFCNKALLVKPHITAQQYQDEVKNNYMKGGDILLLFLLLACL